MYSRTSFTTVTPLPLYISRETIMSTLHSHKEMIELNPLVIHCEPCEPPPHAPADEHDCPWYEITDRISYLPGGLLQGKVSYKASFGDRPRGLQTHVYAPMGLDIRSRWSICGNLPGENRDHGWSFTADAPREGLFLKEEVEMDCLIFAGWFVRGTLEQSHSTLVDRMVTKGKEIAGVSD